MNGRNLKNPYPGLRPFEQEDSDFFFGRETHTEELLRRLSSSRFLAVVGTSGSGKSSLVRAGLIPALYGDLLAAGSHWRVAIFRPGDDPIRAMADELHKNILAGAGATDGKLPAICLRPHYGAAPSGWSKPSSKLKRLKGKTSSWSSISLRSFFVFRIAPGLQGQRTRARLS